MVTERASKLLSFISDAGGCIQRCGAALHLRSTSGHLLVLPLPLQNAQVSLIRAELRRLSQANWFCSGLARAVLFEEVLECYAELLIRTRYPASTRASGELPCHLQHPPAVEVRKR